MGGYQADQLAEPIHEVTVSDFYITKYHITVAQFEEFVNDQGYVTIPEINNKSFVIPLGSEHPDLKMG